MTIDERLERLAERHEALTETVEHLAQQGEEQNKRLDRLVIEGEAQNKRIDRMVGAVEKLTTVVEVLFHSNGNHQERLENSKIRPTSSPRDERE